MWLQAAFDQFRRDAVASSSKGVRGWPEISNDVQEASRRKDRSTNNLVEEVNTLIYNNVM